VLANQQKRSGISQQANAASSAEARANSIRSFSLLRRVSVPFESWPSPRVVLLC
jgi:hypothetical protein